MTNATTPEYRDLETPDVFHKFTDQELLNICNKILSYAAIKKFGALASLELVRDNLVIELENNPNFIKAVYRWRNFNKKD